MAESMAVDDVAMELFDSDMDDFRDTVLDDRLLEDDTDYTSHAQGAMSQTATTAETGTGFMPERIKPAVKSKVYKSKTGAYVGPEACSDSIEEYLYCQVCHIYLMNMKTAVLHYKGKAHQKVLNQLAEKMGTLNVPLLTEDLKQAGQAGDQWKGAQMTPGQGSQAPSSTIQHIDATLLEKSKNVFVDDLGQLWGPERYATNLGQFKNCSLCDVKASSFKTAKEHYTGVKHIKKLKNLASHKGLEFKKIGNCVYEATARGPVERDDDPLGVKGDAEMYAAAKRKSGAAGGVAAKKSKIDGRSFCDVCNLELSSEAVAAMHYEGKKHKRKLELARHETEGVKDRSTVKMTLDLVGSGIFFCPKCDIMCMSQEQLNEHYEGKQHKAAMQAEAEEFEKSKKAAEKATGTEGEPEVKAYGCRICGIKSNSKNQYLEHLESKKHLRKFAQYSEEKLGKRLEKVKNQNFGQKRQPMLDAGRRGQWPNWDRPWEVPQGSDWLEDWSKWTTDQGYGYEEGWGNQFGGGYEEGWGNGQHQEREGYFSEDDWNTPRGSDQMGRGRGSMHQARDVRGDRGPRRPQGPSDGGSPRGRPSNRDGGAPRGHPSNRDGGAPRGRPSNRDGGAPRGRPSNRDGGTPRGRPLNRGGSANIGGGDFGGGYGREDYGSGDYRPGDVNSLELLNNLPSDAIMKVTEVLSNLTKQLLGGMTPGGGPASAPAPAEINWTNDQNYQSYRDQRGDSRASSWGNSDRPGPQRGDSRGSSWGKADRPGARGGRRGMGRGFALR
ncbi:hypothetical protein HOLleu_05592 [Holothuria leucospilota]|uniref:C2H2-type domain-containing protein n=1 Tax=Holothuria leucospilota TaxID=206669 RepID=A0A9Q1HJ23_HOLLE|nr:hypothetical protein HOLleu_05592 [Holothuria leucospilota]